MTMINHSRQEIEAGLIERANQDPAFRQTLLNNPKRTVAQFLGTALPEGMTLTVIEEKPGHHYLVLPPAPPSLDALPLDDLELALVGGGRTLRPAQVKCNGGRSRIHYRKITETVTSSSC